MPDYSRMHAKALRKLRAEKDDALARAEAAEARLAEAERERERLRAIVARVSAFRCPSDPTEECAMKMGELLPLLQETRRCGWCGGWEDELPDPHGPCPQAIDTDAATGEPYICGPHQYVEVAPVAPPEAPDALPVEVRRVVEAAEKWSKAHCAAGGAPSRAAIRAVQEESLWPAENELFAAVASLSQSDRASRAEAPAPQPGPLSKPHSAASRLTQGTHKTAVGHCTGEEEGGV